MKWRGVAGLGQCNRQPARQLTFALFQVGKNVWTDGEQITTGEQHHLFDLAEAGAQNLDMGTGSVYLANNAIMVWVDGGQLTVSGVITGPAGGAVAEAEPKTLISL